MSDPNADPRTESTGNEDGGLDSTTAWLEKIIRDPMADAVTGRVRVLSASEPARRGRYQECQVELAVEAPGIPTTVARQALVFPRNRWPRAGDIVPARISRSQPDALEADWERLSPR